MCPPDSARTNSENPHSILGENEESYSEIHTITNERQLFDAQFNSVEQIGEGQGNLYLLDKALNFLRMGMQFIGVIIAEGFDGCQNRQYFPFKHVIIARRAVMQPKSHFPA